MTEHSESGPLPDGRWVAHKPARECPMSQPHLREECGIVKARERAQAQADERAERGEEGWPP